MEMVTENKPPWADLQRKKPCAIALGIFDGVHLGHQEILGRTCHAARGLGVESAVFSFRNHPESVLRPDGPPPPRFLITPERRITLMKQIGIQQIIIPDFSIGWARTSARDFARCFLCEALQAKYVSVGFNYHFGQRAEGRASDLVRFGQELGFEVDVVPAFCVDGQEISSTRIRESIRAGHLEEPHRLLGRPHELCGRVVQGERRGRTLGYPTANLEPDLPSLLPPGVYAVRVYRDDIGEERLLAEGMLFRGPRRTFGEPKEARSVEVHLFDYEGDLYGAHLRLEVFSKIREGRKFDSPEDLVRQLGLDRAACEDFFRADGRTERREVRL